MYWLYSMYVLLYCACLCMTHLSSSRDIKRACIYCKWVAYPLLWYTELDKYFYIYSVSRVACHDPRYNKVQQPQQQQQLVSPLLRLWSGQDGQIKVHLTIVHRRMWAGPHLLDVLFCSLKAATDMHYKDMWKEPKSSDIEWLRPLGGWMLFMVVWGGWERISFPLLPPYHY